MSEFINNEDASVCNQKMDLNHTKRLHKTQPQYPNHPPSCWSTTRALYLAVDCCFGAPISATPPAFNLRKLYAINPPPEYPLISLLSPLPRRPLIVMCMIDGFDLVRQLKYDGIGLRWPPFGLPHGDAPLFNAA